MILLYARADARCESTVASLLCLAKPKGESQIPNYNFLRYTGFQVVVQFRVHISLMRTPTGL